MSMKTTITEKLQTALAPTQIEVIDESDQHKGHMGYREGGETHFRVRIVSEAFSGQGRVQRHRMINELLADELAGSVHALAIEARAPEEPDTRATRRMG